MKAHAFYLAQGLYVAPKNQFGKPTQYGLAFQDRDRKYFAFPEDKISCMVCPSRFPLRGAARDRHGRWGRNAMDVLVSPDERH
jgi:hypothetical protein